MRYFLAILAVLVGIAGGVYLLRLPVAGFFVRAGMASAGLENPKATVTALSLHHIKITGLAAGPKDGEAFSIETLAANFDAGELISARKVRSVDAGPGTVRLAVAPDGSVSLPGVNPGDGAGGVGLPFNEVALNSIVLIVDAPDGRAEGSLDAVYDVTRGGAGALTLTTDRLAAGDNSIEQASVQFDISLAPDGAATLAGDFTGDIVTAYGPVRNISLTLDGEGDSWRDLAKGVRENFSAAARVTLHSANATLSEFEALESSKRDLNVLIFGKPISTLAASGAIDLAYAHRSLSIDAAAPVAVEADTGARFEITPREEAPAGATLYRRTPDSAAIAMEFRLQGAAVNASGAINAEKTDESWTVSAPIEIGEYRSEAVSLESARADLNVTITPARIDAHVATQTNLRAFKIGRLGVADAPLATDFMLSADRLARTMTVELPRDKCIDLKRARLTLDGQDTEASFTGAELCAGDAPLASIDWSGDMRSAVAGALKADKVDYRLGQTRIAGRPPEIGFTGDYAPDAHLTTLSGKITGGALTLNEFLIFDSSNGRYEFFLDDEMMQLTGWLDSVRVVQADPVPNIAPVLASGEVRLKDKNVDFDYELTTPKRQHLGSGDGVHNVSTGKGRSAFVFDRIEMSKDGIQPSRLAPVMKGLIGRTTGIATGTADFSWSADGILSTADLTFEDVTFVGPTRIVEQTLNLNGDVHFADLWPITTDGVQSITVEGVSLFSLLLENGEIEFEMRGDETLYVQRAEFPWFGGLLGVYDANMSISGAQASVPLRAEGIDLKKVLEFIDIDGLSGEGLLTGVLPLVANDGRAEIESGVLKSEGPGVVRYVGKATEEVASADEQAQIAFDILRNLEYESLDITVNGPLDGRLDFKMNFVGAGEVQLNRQYVQVPVKYQITLDAALLELLNQANLSRDIKLQVEKAVRERD